MHPNLRQSVKKYATLDQFTILRQLGSGFTSSVYLVRDDDGNLFAAKKFSQEKVDKYFDNQINIMKEIAKNQEIQNIVKIYEVREDAVLTDQDGEQENGCVILMEYVDGGELYHYIAYTGRFSEPIAKILFIQLIKALQHMKQKGIAHRDLKPENILLTKQFKIKVSDFGFSCFAQDKILADNLGSTAYKAAQIYKKQYNGYKVDIFAIGAILFTIVFGNNPFSSVFDIRYKFIAQKNYNKFWATFQKEEKQIASCPAFKDLFMKLVAQDPNERPTLEQILQHQWLTQSFSGSQNLQVQMEKRLKIIQKIRQKKIIQQKKRREELMKQANSPLIHRGPENESDQKNIIDIYHEQLDRERMITQVDATHINDIVLDENYTIVLTFLREYLQLEKKTSEEHDQECQKINIIEDNDSLIKLHYIQQRKIPEQQQNFKAVETSVDIEFGFDSEKRFVMKFRNYQGGENQVYYKQKVQEIKELYYYCMVQDFEGLLSKKYQ